MKFRGLDVNGDWMFGQGLGSYAQGQDALALDIAARIRSWKGGCFFAPNDGVDYKNLLEKGQLKNLELALQNCIMQTPGVVKILSFAFTFSAGTRSLSMNATIQTIYSKEFIVTLNNITGGPTSA
jgi:hypothetical protein